MWLLSCPEQDADNSEEEQWRMFVVHLWVAVTNIVPVAVASLNIHGLILLFSSEHCTCT